MQSSGGVAMKRIFKEHKDMMDDPSSHFFAAPLDVS